MIPKKKGVASSFEMMEKDNPIASSGNIPNLYRKIRLVRNFSLLIIVLLFAQFLLGMWTNLFVAFPQSSSLNPLDLVFTNGPYILLVHIVNGLGLGILAVCVVVLSVIVKTRLLILLTSLGMLSILAAGESGILFVVGFYSDNSLSFSMAFGFISALMMYFFTLMYCGSRLSSNEISLKKANLV